MRFRRKHRRPVVLNHEFIIQNHVDIASVLVMSLLLVFILKFPAKDTAIFIVMQYNVTYTTDDNGEQFHFFDYGPKDIATIFFYMLVAINLHTLIQENILNKISSHLHLSKTKYSKFNESGQLAFFYLFSIIWGASILNEEEFIMNPASLWKDYPRSRMLQVFYFQFEKNLVLLITEYLTTPNFREPLISFQVKFFYICQLAYWLHALPELYFQKIEKEDIPRQLCYICLYIAHISGAYVLNFQHLGLILMVPHYLVELIFHASRLFYFSDENNQKGFTIWALLFIMVRLLTLTLSVLTFGFGLARVENPGFSIADGNFNVLPVRIGCLAAVCLTQAWMMWKFINFQLKKWREHVKNQIPKKKTTNTKNKRTKKESNRDSFANGAVKSEDGTSPRRKSKPV